MSEDKNDGERCMCSLSGVNLSEVLRKHPRDVAVKVPTACDRHAAAAAREMMGARFSAYCRLDDMRLLLEAVADWVEPPEAVFGLACVEGSIEMWRVIRRLFVSRLERDRLKVLAKEGAAQGQSAAVTMWLFCCDSVEAVTWCL